MKKKSSPIYLRGSIIKSIILFLLFLMMIFSCSEKIKCQKVKEKGKEIFHCEDYDRSTIMEDADEQMEHLPKQ